MASWNGLDFFIFLIFALNTILGMSRGATKEIISFMCLSLALIFTIKFTVPLAAFFNRSPLIADVVNNKIIQNFMFEIGAGPLTQVLLMEIFFSLSMLVCFVGIFSICEAGLSYSGFMEVFSFPYATMSRKVGAALGCVRGYVITLLLIVIVFFHLLRGGVSETINNSVVSGSFFINLFKSNARTLDDLIAAQQPEKYRDVYRGKDLFKAEDVIKALSNETQ